MRDLPKTREGLFLIFGGVLTPSAPAGITLRAFFIYARRKSSAGGAGKGGNMSYAIAAILLIGAFGGGKYLDAAFWVAVIFGILCTWGVWPLLIAGGIWLWGTMRG